MTLKRNNQPVKGVIPHTHKERMTPQSLENEDYAIGAMIASRDALNIGVEMLEDDDFYYEKNCEIFRVLKDLFNRTQHIDIAIIKLELQRRGTLDKIGDTGHLIDLIAECPAVGNIEIYAQRIKDCALQRAYMRIGEEMQNAAGTDEGDINSLVEVFEKKIFDLGQRRLSGKFAVLPDLLDNVYESLNEQREQFKLDENCFFGVPSGLTGLDKMIGGWQKTDLILVAARPGMGKTSLGLNAAHHAALIHSIPVAFFSLEMSEKQLVQRFLAMDAKISLQELRRGSLKDDDWKRLTKSVSTLKSAPIYIDEAPGLTVAVIHAKLRRLLSENKEIGLVIIDYLQLIRGTGHESRVQEVAEIGRSLKEMAKDLDIPVMAICQLSRAVEMRGERVPMLSDLRESGSLEAEADIVLFPFRKAYYKNHPVSDGRGGYKPTQQDVEKQAVDESEAQIIIGKHRNGGLGTIEVTWRPEWATFANKELHSGEVFSEHQEKSAISTTRSQTPLPRNSTAKTEESGDPSLNRYDENDPFSDE